MKTLFATAAIIVAMAASAFAFDPNARAACTQDWVRANPKVWAEISAHGEANSPERRRFVRSPQGRRWDNAIAYWCRARGM
jgi:hypothetical protein